MAKQKKLKTEGTHIHVHIHIHSGGGKPKMQANKKSVKWRKYGPSLGPANPRNTRPKPEDLDLSR